jgi:outer membrane receptor protein involved in Fe transport
MLRDTESVITSPLLSTFRPAAPTHVPLHSGMLQILGRGDANLSASDSLMVRYRLSQGTISPWQTGPTLAPERAVDNLGRGQDAAIIATHVWGSHGLNEFRGQFARTFFDNDPTHYCAGCFSEERVGFKLGKDPAFPNSLTENRWEVADSVTWLRSGTLGDHVLKAGVDASVVGVQFVQLKNADGTFTFDTNQPFDAGIPSTFPTSYTWTVGDRVTPEHTKLFALFMQDEWKLRSQVTLNLGARWDYQDVPGLSHETGRVAPRLGAAWDPWKTGKTVLRASYGLYYDQAFLRIARDVDQARNMVLNVLAHPGYPLPFGFNQLRTSGPIIPIQDTTRLANDLHTPYTAQATVGTRHEIGSDIAVSVDGVWARGHHLFLTHDLNYPDLSTTGMVRPDPNFRKILEVESRGHSWYNALQVGVEKRHTHRYSCTAAYTLSSAERDTEDYLFIAQDPHNEAAERGPSSSDVRHRLTASINVDLPRGLRLTAISTAQSALPFTITTGTRNLDDDLIVRPNGVGRNSARGTAFSQTDVRLSKAVRIKAPRIELLAEAFNLTNRPNWTAYNGQKGSPTYGRPTSATGSREVQLGIRVDF